MSDFKVSDLKVNYRESQFCVLLDGSGAGDVVSGIAGNRLGAVATILNKGRVLYWDSSLRMFYTNPTRRAIASDSTPESREGEVMSWDVMIPAEGSVSVSLVLKPDNTSDVSGDQEVSPTTIEIDDDAALFDAFEILTSSPAWYKDGQLRPLDGCEAEERR